MQHWLPCLRNIQCKSHKSTIVDIGMIRSKTVHIDLRHRAHHAYNGCKQFIRSKPIRFGFKAWVLASSTGMPYYVDIYEGKKDYGTKNDPLGVKVVRSALNICQKPKNHHVFFDNFFTSYTLVKDLKEKGFRATGTVRADRIAKCPLNDFNTMKKSARGTYDYRSDGDVVVVRWNDNAVVTICSNAIGCEPLGDAKRWIKQKGKTTVKQPAIIKAYNQGMGGVDLVDRALSDFRPSIKGKKWYWPLVVNGINLAMVYAWRLYQLVSNSKVDQKEFRRKIVHIMIKSASTTSAKGRAGPRDLCCL